MGSVGDEDVEQKAAKVPSGQAVAATTLVEESMLARRPGRGRCNRRRNTQLMLSIVIAFVKAYKAATRAL